MLPVTIGAFNEYGQKTELDSMIAIQERTLTRFGLNDLDHGGGNYAGWSVIGLHRHKQRQANTWGLGVAFREVHDARAPGGYRRQYGGDALWRVDFLDKPFTYYFATDLACYPRQCALGFSGGVGFYF